MFQLGFVKSGGNSVDGVGLVKKERERKEQRADQKVKEDVFSSSIYLMLFKTIGAELLI